MKKTYVSFKPPKVGKRKTPNRPWVGIHPTTGRVVLFTADNTKYQLCGKDYKESNLRTTCVVEDEYEPYVGSLHFSVEDV